MDKICLNAMAKINLGLDVVRKREDGYHEVRMIMQTVNLYDTLTFTKKKEKGIHITTDKENIPTGEGNLIYKAARLVAEEYGLTNALSVHLEKRIPMAAGMAGGSTDAAATLSAMNQLFDLHMSMDRMMELGVRLGADVPYCLIGGTALSEGIGEKLTALPPAPDCILLLAKPDIAVSTKFVYENLRLDLLEKHPDIDGMTEAVRSGNLQQIAERMENVLESVTIKEYPIISEIKTLLKKEGADAALMSGSGPTVFGIFSEKRTARQAYEKLRETGLAKEMFLTGFVRHTCVETGKRGI